MIGESLSTTGTWMQVMAEAWVMTSLTSSAFIMGLTTFASGLPVLLLTMVGGKVADRVPKRTVLVITQIAQISLATTMGMLVYTQTVQVWHIILVAAALGVVNAFEMPAASALVPELVSREEIGDALAIDRSTFHLTRLIGPATAGLVIGLWGPSVAFFVNALSFVPLMIALRTLPPPLPEIASDTATDDGGIKAGLVYVRQDPLTFAMIGIMGLLTLFPMPVMMVMLPLYARLQLGLDATGMGLMMSTNAGGALIGSILLLRVRRERRPRTIAAMAVGVGIGFVGIATFKAVSIAWCLLFGLSICLATTFGLVNTTIQERVPNRLRGRVSAIAQMTFFGGAPFAALGMSSLADAIGLTRAFLVAGPLYALGALTLLAVATRAPADPAKIVEAA